MARLASGLRSSDATGNGLAGLAPADVAAVLAAFPRLDFKKSARETIVRCCETKSPASLLLHPWESAARRLNPDFPVPYVDDLIQAAPFDS